MRDDRTATTVSIVYLARLREAFGTAGERVDVPAGVSTAGTLRDWLAARGGAFARELAAGRAVRIAVNHDLATAETPIRAGDEVALFPPVTGG
jgi:molybdopterin synthase sulfur carrier subunit